MTSTDLHPDDLMDREMRSDLSAVERTRLKESFGAIRRWQEMAAYHYQTEV